MFSRIFIYALTLVRLHVYLHPHSHPHPHSDPHPYPSPALTLTLTLTLILTLTLSPSDCISRETRPKILWNTGTKLQAAKDKTAIAAVPVPEAVPAKVLYKQCIHPFMSLP